MKLPDFSFDNALLHLKRAMGVPADAFGDVRRVEIGGDRARIDEIDTIGGQGLDIGAADIQFLGDGTIAYKDRRILIHIRDISQYGGHYGDPKFHFSACAAVLKMIENARFDRYVAAGREDGTFLIRYQGRTNLEERRLDVCQNCLSHLKYNGFQLGMERAARERAVRAFSIVDFFEKYPKSLHVKKPRYIDTTAPDNKYPSNFSEISRAYRESIKWRCETCAIDLSREDLRRYLHVHHINGLKNEGHASNLKAVCVHCHAEEPMHAHIKAQRQYREFEAIWQKQRAG